MKILLIEDDDRKAENISRHIVNHGIQAVNIVRAKNYTDFVANLHNDIGLFIIDIKIPIVDDAAATRNGESILEAIVKAGKDSALLLAISSYPDDFAGLREKFEARGCILCDYSKQEWMQTLDHLLVQLNKQMRFDFLIFCALKPERSPYISLFPKGDRNVRGDIECYDIEIDGRCGSIIILPQMGLVNAAVVASICIDRYRPMIVGMSGICGGFTERTNLGQLVISSTVYEYQSGKWSHDGFLEEPYQVQTDNSMLTRLRVLIDEPSLLSEIESGFIGQRPASMKNPAIGIFTSGSAVIADDEFMEKVKDTHRKVSAVDMEIFAVQRAAELSPCKPVCICAKTVVDLCDKKKNDELHPYGSHISARFLIKALSSFFKGSEGNGI